MNYKYILFVPWSEYAAIQYSDLNRLDNVKLVYNPFKKGLCGRCLFLLYRIHFISRIHKFLPFKSLWNSFLFDASVVNENEKNCFIFFISDLREHRQLIQALKNKYKDAKFVMYLEDTVASRTNFDHKSLKKNFDLVFSYDADDCKKYGFIYYPTPYSRLGGLSENALPESDLFFCGLAKNRLKTILDVYNKCRLNNIYCDFNICSEDIPIQNSDGINYLKTTMPYSEYLKHLSKTNCILEINQKGAVGYSLRVWEALVYGKKLMTNNKNILQEPFYNPEQFSIIDTPSSIDIDFIKKEKAISPRFVEELSPKRMIAFIDAELTKKYTI